MEVCTFGNLGESLTKKVSDIYDNYEVFFTGKKTCEIIDIHHNIFMTENDRVMMNSFITLYSRVISMIIYIPFCR